jgi:hypothetical protein
MYPVVGNFDVKNPVKNNVLYIVVMRTYVFEQPSLGREYTHTRIYVVYQVLFILWVVCNRKGRALDVFVTQHPQVNGSDTKETFRNKNKLGTKDRQMTRQTEALLVEEHLTYTNLTG